MKKIILSFLCLTTLTFMAIFLVGCDIETQAHKHLFTQEIVEEKYLCSTATCMEKAKYYYSCECGEKGTETFEYGEKANHSFTNYISDGNATFEQDGTKTAHCDYAGCDATDTITEKDSKLKSTLQFKTLSLNENKVYGNVGNSTEAFDFASEIQALGSLTYFISSDSEGTQKIDKQTVSLLEGENKFYITELLEGVKKSVYEVIIYRNHIYSVTFKNGDTIVESRQIEENAVITEPTSAVEKTAYTFTGWDYDFAKPITKETTINACWQAVEYSITYNTDGGEMQESINTYTIENEILNLTSPTRAGYTFKYWTDENGDITDVILKGSYGNKTLTANWSIDVYLSSDGTTVKGLSYDGVKDLVILSEYNGIKVTNIESSAFLGFSDLSSVTIPEGIVNIGDNAFKYCSGIKSITIPASVTTVGNSVFKDCENLESVIWNARYCKSVGSSDAPIFEGCNKLTSVTIGESVKKLPSYMFCGCNTLKTITIPESVTSIEDATFYNFSSLESITISENITSIGNLAFYGCTGLTKVIWNAEYCENVGSVSSPIFSGCTKLTNVEIGKAVKFIPSNIFASCVNLTSVSIAEGAEKIGSSAFLGCTGLTEITIPQSLITIEESAFSGCENLTNIVIPSGVTSIANSTFYNCSKLTSVTIPNKVTYIGEKAFYACVGLTTLTMPEYVSTIGSYAFYNCSSLTDISIKSYITSIGEYVFADCTNLKNVEISGQTTDLGSYLFNNCTKLSKVTMPKNVNEIGENAFNNCTSLVNLTMPDTATNIGMHAFYNCSSLTEIVVPNGVKGIGKGAFEGCSGLTKVTLPQSVTDLGKRVFCSCTSLTGIVIPDGITKINDDSFSGCTSLSSITLNKNITGIGENAFKDCNLTYNTDGYANYLGCDGNDYFFLINSIKANTYHEQINANTKVICDYAFVLCSTIKEVTIPDSVTYIGNYAFCYCRDLVSVRKSTTSNVLEIGESAFDSCSSLSGIQILDSVHTIKKAAFFGCAFTKLTIPKSVRIIEERAFENCESLEQLIIKNGTTTIGDYAFYNCEKLYNISIPKSVKSIGNYAFAEVDYVFYYILYEGTYSEFYENITLGEGWKDSEGVIMSSDSSYTVGKKELYPTNPDEWFN